MSNRLVNLVHRLKGVKGPARAVLLVLADEARDYAEGRSTLTTAQIADRTGLSRRTVHRAYVDLITAGHITREASAPGAAVSTIVHPGCPAVSAPATVSEGSATLSAPLCQPVRGSYSIKDSDQDKPSPTAGARKPAALEEEKQPEAAADPVDALFDRWDAMATALKIPGPATRSMARRAAMAARIAEFGAGQMAMAIDTAERKARAGAFRRANGQGDLFLTIDALLGLGNARALSLLERLLEGDGFGVADGRAAVAGDEPATVAVASAPGEGPVEAEIRAAAAELLGRAGYQAWLAPAGMKLGPDGLTITVGSAFAADHITNQIAPRLRRPGMAVRVVRERVQA